MNAITLTAEPTKEHQAQRLGWADPERPASRGSNRCLSPESLVGFNRNHAKTRRRESVQRRGDPALATERHHTKEHNVPTMDFELIDAALNAPTGLEGLAADMADLADREPTNDRHAHPSNPAAYAIHAARHWQQLRDARVISERVNALADKWEQMGRLCVAARGRLRSAHRVGSSPASAHNHGCH